MARAVWSSKVSSEPSLAPKDYRSLPPIVRLDDGDWYSGLWHGSGFQVSDLQRQYRWENGEPSACAACGSKRTRCIYFKSYFDQSGKDIDLELVCRDCGKYTLYNGYD
jgi:hypothetical protein